MSMHNFHFWVQDHKLWSGPPSSDIWWKSWKFFFLHVLSNNMCKFAINLSASAESHLKMLIYYFFLMKMQIWNGYNALNIAGNPIKDINAQLSYLSSGSQVVEWTSQFWYLVEILEIVLLHVLSNDTCKFAMNLYYFSLLEMQIWNGCNALNIAGNPIKDVNAQLSFLSSGSQVVEWTPNSDIWWKSWKFFFLCMYSPMMHANLP